MKTSSLRKFAWVFFALTLTTTTVLAQGWRRGNNVQNNQNQPCLTQVSDLSKEQVAKIGKLEASHQEQMAELREQRQLTTNAIEKSEIRTNMLKNVEAHRNAVKALLNEDQQKQYDQLQGTAGNGRNQNFGHGRGNGNANFRGQGSGCRNRTYAKGNGNGQNNQCGNQGRGGNCMRHSN